MENIRKGVKVIFTGEIIHFIAKIIFWWHAILLWGSVECEAFDIVYIQEGPRFDVEEMRSAFLHAARTCGGVAMLVVVLAAILLFVGIGKASRDNRNFRVAWIWVLAYVAVMGITYLLTDSMYARIFGILEIILNALAIGCVIQSIRAMCPESEMAEDAKWVLRAILILLLGSAIATVLRVFEIFIIAAAVISFLCEMICMIKYISFLARVSKM